MNDIKSKLSALGEEINALEKRRIAINELIQAISNTDYFTASEKKKLKQEYDFVLKKKENKTCMLKSHLDLYENEIKGLEEKINLRSTLIDDIIKKNQQTIMENNDILDIFRNEHESLISKIKKSKTEIIKDD